jgi:hypothetical protein
MDYRVQVTVALAAIGLGLAYCPAQAAAEGETQESRPAQTQTGDKSYLPPWMQKQDVAGIGNGAAGTSDPSNPASAPKPPAADQQQRPQQKHRDFPYLPSLRRILPW